VIGHVSFFAIAASIKSDTICLGMRNGMAFRIGAAGVTGLEAREGAGDAAGLEGEGDATGIAAAAAAAAGKGKTKCHFILSFPTTTL